MNNVELKAELRDLPLARTICRVIGAHFILAFEQTDNYYRIPSGKLKKREYYREVETNRPAMLAGGDGVVAVRGGVLFDPSAPPPARAKGRSVSERPPGL